MVLSDKSKEAKFYKKQYEQKLKGIANEIKVV